MEGGIGQVEVIMFAEWGSLTLRMVYHLNVTSNCNVVLLVNLKGVIDGERVLGKMGSTAE